MVSTETDRQDFVVRSYATGCCHGNVKEGGGDRLNVRSEFTQCSDNARYPWCERGGGKRRSNGILSCHQIIKMSINKAGSAWKLLRVNDCCMRTSRRLKISTDAKQQKLPILVLLVCKPSVCGVNKVRRQSKATQKRF